MFTSLSPSFRVSRLGRGGEVIKTQACQFQRHAPNHHNGFPLKRCLHSVPCRSPREFSWPINVSCPLLSFQISITHFSNCIQYYISSVFHWLVAYCLLDNDRVEWCFLSLTPIKTMITPQGVMWEKEWATLQHMCLPVAFSKEDGPTPAYSIWRSHHLLQFTHDWQRFACKSKAYMLSWS